MTLRPWPITSSLRAAGAITEGPPSSSSMLSPGVREEDLARALHLQLKQLRRTLQILKDDKLVANDQRKEEQLKHLTLQVASVKDLQVPEFGSLQAWEAVANATGTANGDSTAHDPYKSGGVGYPKVEVEVASVEVKEETGTDAITETMKMLPPWMIREGMNFTKEQRGEVKPELKMDQSSTPADEKKPKVEKEDEKDIQDEYINAYYAALVKRTQQESERQGASTSGHANGVSEAPNWHEIKTRGGWKRWCRVGRDFIHRQYGSNFKIPRFRNSDRAI